MAWTTPRTWTDGELVTKAIMDVHVRDNFNTVDRLIVPKTADETVTSSTTLQNDDHLSFAVGINTVWYLRLGLYVLDASDGVGNLKVGVTFPASAVCQLNYVWLGLGGTLTHMRVRDATGVAVFGTATGDFHEFRGILKVAGTSGTFQFQFAQNTSNGSGVTVKQHSFIAGRQLA